MHLRHNNIRDVSINMLEEVCYDIKKEPVLLSLSGETFSLNSANKSEEARADISARGVFQPMDKVFFDVRIFHPASASNSSVADPFLNHEQQKKREYNQRIIDVEKASFVPLVYSTCGGEGKEAAAFNKRLALLLSAKRNLSYSDAISYVRRRIRFSILQTTLLALRGYRGKCTEKTFDEDSDLDLIPTAQPYR